MNNNSLIRVIDTETTGFDPDIDKVVEIGSIDLDLIHGTFTNERERLINPGRPIPPEASAVHHIIDSDVRCEPHLSEVIDDFMGADYYVAHNAGYDRQFLSFPDWKWICTMKCAARIWPGAPGYSNQVLRYWLKLYDPLDIDRHEINPHRAVSDVYVTGAIMLELLKHFSVPQLHEWSLQPMLIREFSFGKHKGEKLGDVPTDYLSWILNEDFDEDLKWNVKREINKRKAA